MWAWVWRAEARGPGRKDCVVSCPAGSSEARGGCADASAELGGGGLEDIAWSGDCVCTQCMWGWSTFAGKGALPREKGALPRVKGALPRVKAALPRVKAALPR
eukprot:2807236-Pleurochrysis_carterae.AAC.1